MNYCSLDLLSSSVLDTQLSICMLMVLGEYLFAILGAAESGYCKTAFRNSCFERVVELERTGSELHFEVHNFEGAT